VIVLLVFSLSLALAGSQRLLYRLFCRIQASSLWWLRLTGVLAVLGIQSALLTRCPGPLNPLLSDTSLSRKRQIRAMQSSRQLLAWE